MVYCDIQDVINEAKIKPAHFGLTSDEELTNRVQKWAEEAKSWTDEYTDNTFPDYPDHELPRVITLASEEIIHNIIISRRVRQDAQYIQSNDWTMKNVPYEIFTDSIKSMLKPYIKGDKYSESNVDFFVVTGHPLGQKHKNDDEEEDW